VPSNPFEVLRFGSSILCEMANSGTMRDATQISAEEIKQEEYTELSKRRRIGFSKRKGKKTREWSGVGLLTPLRSHADIRTVGEWYLVYCIASVCERSNHI